MKKVQAIIRPEKLEALKDAVLAEGIGGITISMVHGCGTQKGWKEYYRGSEIIMNMISKVECEFVVADEEVDKLTNLICETCKTGEVGDGKIFVSPVETAIRIRTGERGEDAIQFFGVASRAWRINYGEHHARCELVNAGVPPRFKWVN